MPSKSSSSTEIIQCGNDKCRTTVTPLWRKGWKRTDGDGKKGRDSYVMLCNSCGLHYKKGHFCYHCMQIYREKDCDDSTNPWISCERCHRWVHATCERSRNPNLEHQIAEEYGFYCQDCRLLKAKLNQGETLFSNTFPDVKKRRKRPLLSSSKMSCTSAAAGGATLTGVETPNSPLSSPPVHLGGPSSPSRLTPIHCHHLQSPINSSPASPTTPLALPSLAALFNTLALSPMSPFRPTRMESTDGTNCTTTTTLPPISTLQPPLPMLNGLSSVQLPSPTTSTSAAREVIPLHQSQQISRQRHSRALKPLLPAPSTVVATTLLNRNTLATQESAPRATEENGAEETDGTRHLKLRLKNIRNKQREEGKSPLKSDKMSRLSPTVEVSREKVLELYENSKWRNQHGNNLPGGQQQQQQDAKLAQLWAVCAAERETMEEAQ